jgi:DUF1680 family protein
MLSRRTFLSGAAGCGFAHAERRGRNAVEEFAYADARLTGGPLAAMHRRIQAHFLGLDEDRLLKVYRQKAGMPAPGRDMGGWYDANGFVPGHLIGQIISGLSRFYANTGEREAARKARRLVEGYAATLERDGNPYASPNATATWPCYILDKHEIGLLDAANLAGVETARTLLPRVIEGARRFIPDHTFDRMGVRNPPYDEPYILPENLFKTWELTGDERFLKMARLYLLDDGFFDPLARGENILPGKHGYSHVIALSSGAKAYEVLGDAKYLRAIRNAWEMIVETQQFASGAWAPRETFVQAHSGELAASLTATRDHFETPCCYYAHAKLARYLMRFTGDARYGDGLERVLFNTILGALDPDDDGGYFYYSDYQGRARKRYYQRKWPCCAGTLIQSVADYPLNIYFRDERGIYVSLYAASTARWKAGGVPVTLTQRTAYPESEDIELQVDPEAPAEFAVRLRIPGWLERPAQISVNGKVWTGRADRGTFAAIRRRWRKGDTIEIGLPFSFRTVPVDDRDQAIVALMYGPLMLNAIDAPEPLTARREALAKPDRVSGKPLEFDCRAAGATIRMRPFYQIERETYSTYFRLTAEV